MRKSGLTAGMARACRQSPWRRQHQDSTKRNTSSTKRISRACCIWILQLQDATEMYGRAIRQAESRWYGNAILGYMPCNLRGPEWVYPAKHNCYGDYGKPILKYFRKYLREKYQDDLNALQEAWQNPTVTFDTAEIPSLQRRQGQNEHFLNDDCQDILDYNRALQRGNTDAIMAFMDTIQQNAPGKLRWLYYGYLMTLNHLYGASSYTGHYDVMRLLESGKVDVMASPVRSGRL